MIDKGSRACLRSSSLSEGDALVLTTSGGAGAAGDEYDSGEQQSPEGKAHPL
jgi:hypothetical protein